MSTVRRIVFAFSVFVAGLLLPGCNPAKCHLAVFNASFEAANYTDAAQYACKRIKKRKTPSGDDLLWTLQLAAVERTQLKHQQSTAYFDKAEEMFNYYAPQSELLDTVGSTIINDNLVPYKGEEYDKIMVNTYKALNFIADGNLDLARVELNRALDRQMRARENFNAEIRKLDAQLQKQKDKSKQDVKAIVDDPNITSRIAASYPNLDSFKPYPDFVNPFTTFLAALYFNLIGEHSRAEYLLKESCGMVPDNKYLAQDLLLTDDVLSGKSRLENTVWVIFENGLGPVKEEVRIDLPLFLATKSPRYVGVALPRLLFRGVAYPYLTVHTDSGTYKTEQLADMERVIQTEFKKDFKGILTRAIASAVLKATTQVALQNQDNGALPATLVAVFSYATTAADVRIWSTLPKDFQIARCPIPQNRSLTIIPQGGPAFGVDIPACRNAVVYVKIIRTGTQPICEVLAFY